ncbi:MAG: mechanosensitive ion channel [Lachnospiraceae bacterium]|nr:mechanosensitive ion channel [Lachnospiraceae bacterium]
MFRQFLDTIPAKAFGLGTRIVFALICAFIGYILIKVVLKIVKKSMERAKAETGIVQFVQSFLRAGLWILLIFLIAGNFGVDAASIAALLGSAGVAISLALQGSLSNIAGGMLILCLHTFRVGDYIKEDTHGNEGTVSEIHMFYTKLLTFDGKTVVLPNGTLANSSLVNYTASGTRRLDLDVDISYDSDLKKAKEVIVGLLEEHPNVLKDYDRIVAVDNLGNSAVELTVKCYVHANDYFRVKWDLLEQIKLSLDENGIVIPYPQLDVHQK